MIVAGIQHDTVWEDPAANFEHLAPMIAEAVAGGARLVVLTEMYSTGFSMKTDRTAEPPDGRSAQFLVDQAREHDVAVCGSLPERAVADALPYNQLVVALPDGTTHRYAKIHPFSFGRETEHFAAGGPTLTLTLDHARFSFFVCYDLRFAGDFWNLAPTTDCYVIPANWPAARRDHWTTLLRARAIENQAFVVGVNRVGTGGKLSYAGDSMIIGPFGETCAQAGDEETIITTDVDPEHVRKIRAEYPFLQDR
jgi:predicted amidohydrolase